MVWARQKLEKKSLHSRRKTSKKHLKLQFWLWRKSKENRIKRRAPMNLYRSRPRIPSNTNTDRRVTIQVSTDVENPHISEIVANGTAKKKEESCSNYKNVASVSSLEDFTHAPVDIIDLSECSHPLPGEEEDSVIVVQENVQDISTFISKNIREYLHDFYQKYGSFIPLEKSDLTNHLKDKSQKDLNDYEMMMLEITIEEMARILNTVPCFEIKYKKHRLTLADLSTLANEMWLNDQVINMYGELIMDLAHTVHFLNSFFHRQLLTKGYEGVKRWTKKVDLFSKRLLLVPVHLDDHWCLVTVDFVEKKVCLYDSQGGGLDKVARNILKYLLKEAKEKKQTAFEEGWTVSLAEEIPQQTNENDCGVFVLEYSRCLALSALLQFSQKNIPKIRKRIYKELCECKLC